MNIPVVGWLSSTSPRCLALFEAKGGNRDPNEPLTPLGGSAANGLL
jgi:hypothetical protein